jgi:hypothetical protein
MVVWYWRRKVPPTSARIVVPTSRLMSLKRVASGVTKVGTSVCVTSPTERLRRRTMKPVLSPYTVCTGTSAMRGRSWSARVSKTLWGSVTMLAPVSTRKAEPVASREPSTTRRVAGRSTTMPTTLARPPPSRWTFTDVAGATSWPMSGEPSSPSHRKRAAPR